MLEGGGLGLRIAPLLSALFLKLVNSKGTSVGLQPHSSGKYKVPPQVLFNFALLAFKFFSTLASSMVSSLQTPWVTKTSEQWLERRGTASEALPSTIAKPEPLLSSFFRTHATLSNRNRARRALL